MASHTAVNRAYWDSRAEHYEAAGRQNWAATEPRWGLWGVAQSQVPLIPEDVSGLDVIELGCGTAYLSAWLARRGARPVGIDNSPRQLATARGLQREHGLSFPLVLGDAEAAPFPGASFDLAISEYGAAIWCDPYRWIPEAARLLRPGGRLIFMGNSTLEALCERTAGPATDRLARDLFGLCRMDWNDPAGACVEYHLPHGEMIRLLRRSGFMIEDLIEIQAPEGGADYDYVTLEWARRWPAEEAWFARLEGSRSRPR